MQTQIAHLGEDIKEISELNTSLAQRTQAIQTSLRTLRTTNEEVKKFLSTPIPPELGRLYNSARTGKISSETSSATVPSSP